MSGEWIHYLLGWTSTPWFDRIAIRDVFDDVGSKYVPPHVNIFYCFGGLVFTSFIAQVTTGAAMTFYYVPEVSRSITYDNLRGVFTEDECPYSE